MGIIEAIARMPKPCSASVACANASPMASVAGTCCGLRHSINRMADGARRYRDRARRDTGAVPCDVDSALLRVVREQQRNAVADEQEPNHVQVIDDEQQSEHHAETDANRDGE